VYREAHGEAHRSALEGHGQRSDRHSPRTSMPSATSHRGCRGFAPRSWPLGHQRSSWPPQVHRRRRLLTYPSIRRRSKCTRHRPGERWRVRSGRNGLNSCHCTRLVGGIGRANAVNQPHDIRNQLPISRRRSKWLKGNDRARPGPILAGFLRMAPDVARSGGPDGRSACGHH
jgi:hypothetical protein